MGVERKAVITGITGQDGSYLAELLLEKEYKVVGVSRSRQYLNNVEHILGDITTRYGDITDTNFIYETLSEHMPDEFYNLASVSTIPECWDKSLAVQVNGVAPIYILDAIRRITPNTKFFQASSREIFGNYPKPMDEMTPYSVENTYASAKLLAHNTVGLYRKRYNLFACSGILFNHESPRRGAEFVTRKITKYVAQRKRHRKLKLGDLDTQRDWGYAGDFVRAMWLMLQQEEPDDYVISTGILHSIREVCEIAFGGVGWDYSDCVELDTRFIRSGEILAPVGNSKKAREILGWKPEVSFREMIQMMLATDLQEDHGCK
jgi:GDPmannose 4,6-dehydratase